LYYYINLLKKIREAIPKNCLLDLYKSYTSLNELEKDSSANSQPT